MVEIYEDFVEALSLANDVEIDVILQNRLPELIDRVKRVGTGVKTEMGTVVHNATSYINEIELHLYPKCMYLLDRDMEQHSDSGESLAAVMGPLFNLTQQELVHFKTSWGAYMSGNVSLTGLAQTLNDRGFYEQLAIYIADADNYIVTKIKIGERIKLHSDNVYAFLVALVDEQYFFEESKHFERFNYTTIDVVRMYDNRVLSAPKLKASPKCEVS